MSKEGTVEIYENPGLRKAAIFVLVMGDALAAEIFARLTEKEIRILGQTAASLQNVSPEEVAEVLREFKRQFHGGHVPRKGAGPAFHLMLEQALGEERAMDLMGIDTYEDPFGPCRQADSDTLASLLMAEHPQTRAIVLSRLGAKKAAEVMTFWSEEINADLVYRIGHLGPISRDIERDVGQALSSLLQISSTDEEQPEGNLLDMTVDIVKGLPPNQEERLFQLLQKYDSAFATEIANNLFRFQDLAGLDSRSMQRLLREVDSQVLLLAMRGVSEEFASQIYEAMSSRAAQIMRDDLATMGPRRMEDVEEARTTIMNVAFRLEEEGVISLPRGNDELV